MKKAQQKIIQETQVQISGISDLEQTIEVDNKLCSKDHCGCLLCRRPLKMPPQKYTIRDLTNNSSQWFHQILTGLTPRSVKTLKINIPDICFPSDQGFIVYETNKKDLRIKKNPGTTPYKQLYSTLVQMKRQYKRILQQNFANNMSDKINPEYVHRKYFQQVLPSHFHDGFNSHNLVSNKFKFKNYLLHDNDKYLISAIEEHKMNDKEPFCVIRYYDTNSQLFNQKQFEVECLSHRLNDIAYIQSYMKTKQQVKSLYFTDYIQGSQDIDKKLFQRAELQVLIMLGGISIYDDEYIDLENLQQQTNQLMKNDPEEYIKLMTYKIVHYLAMASRIYVAQLKLKWIANDIQLFFLQDVLSLRVSQKSKRHIRYFLPKVEQDQSFYRDSRYFLAVYKELKFSKDNGRLRKLEIDHSSQHFKKSHAKHLKKLDKTARISKTIELEPNNEKRYKKLTLPKLSSLRLDLSKQKQIPHKSNSKLNKSTRVTLQSQDFL